jgi:hypothetical protein
VGQHDDRQREKRHAWNVSRNQSEASAAVFGGVLL